MEQFILVVISGVSVGCIYGLVGFTFTAIYNSAKVINFAQGEFLMLGAFAGYIITTSLHLPYIVSIVAGLVLVSTVSLLIYLLMIRPLLAQGASPPTMIMATMACALLISGAVALLTGFQWLTVPAPLGMEPWSMGVFRILPQQVLIIGTTFILVSGYWLFEKKTMPGIALRAIGSNRELAALVGISTSAMVALAFVISGAMAVFAGLLIAPLTAPTAYMGLHYLVNGFIAAILGGFGIPYGAIIGGLMLGLLESFVAGYFSTAYINVIVFLFLVLMLLLRPKGFLGRD